MVKKENFDFYSAEKETTPLDLSKTQAIIFPDGQGSQFIGMGRDLYDNYQKARDIYDEAERRLGFAITEIAFSDFGWGSSEGYHQKTFFVQLIVFLHNEASLKSSLDMEKAKPEFFAGRSAAHVNALYSSGAVDFKNALFLMQTRGWAMSLANKERPGRQMSFVLKRNGNEDLFKSQREKFFRRSKDGILGKGPFLEADNSDTQYVICGSSSEIDSTFQRRKKFENEGIYLKKLPGGAYHSPHMKPAKQAFKWMLNKNNVEIKDAETPVISNVTGKPIWRAQDIKDDLLEQIVNTVLWRQTNEFLDKNEIFPQFVVGKKIHSSELSRRNITIFEHPPKSYIVEKKAA